MNKETEEILDRLKKQYNIDIKLGKEIANDFAEYRLNHKELTLLLDYITNLQERKITKEDVDKYFEENMCVSFDKFIENWNEQEELANYYKKENEKLKEENKRIFSKVNDDELLISNAMNYAEAQKYKSRNEKAIEYLANCDWNCKDFENLYDILGGDDNE